MSGPYDSVIGVEKELVLHKFLTGMPGKFEAAKGNPKMCAALVRATRNRASHARFSASCWGSRDLCRIVRRATSRHGFHHGLVNGSGA